MLLVALLEGKKHKKNNLQAEGGGEESEKTLFLFFTAAFRGFFPALPGALGKIPLSHVGKQTERMDALFFFFSPLATRTPLFFFDLSSDGTTR